MPTIYPFSSKAAAGLNYEGAAGGHYANQPVDGARVAIQGIGNGIMTKDAAASWVSSPVGVSTTLATTLTTPESAVQITLFNLQGGQLKVCEVNASFSTYYVLPSNSSQTFDIANTGYLYLEAAGSTATTAFAYTLV